MKIPAGFQDMPLSTFFKRESVILALFCLAGVALGLTYLFMPGTVFIVMLLLFGIVLTGVVKPEYTFYLMLFVLVEEMVHFFIIYAPVYDIRIYPYYLPLFITAIGFSIAKIAHKLELVRTPVDAPLLMVVVYECVSVLWAPHLDVAVWLSVLLLCSYLLFFLAKNIIRNDVILRNTVRFWITAGVLSAIAIVVSKWVTYEKTIYFSPSTGLKLFFEAQFTDRPSGLAGADHVSGFVATAIFIAFGAMAAVKKRKVKFAYLILIVFMLYSVILTASRGVLLGVGGAYIFFILMHSHFKGKILRFTFLCIMVTLFIVLLAKPGLIDRMMIGFGYTGELIFSSKSFSGTETTTSNLTGMSYRVEMWKRGLKAMQNAPLKFIVGLGNGGFLYYAQETPEVNSISFAFFYDMGLFGIFILILFLYALFKAIYPYMRNDTSNGERRTYAEYMLLGATAAFVAEAGIHGLVDYDLTSYGTKYFWFPLGVVMGIINIVKAERNAALQP